MPVKTKTKVESFKVTSGYVACTDPCYQSPEVHVPAVNGDWVARTEKSDEGSWGVRIARLIVHHTKFSPIGNKYEIKRTMIGVDSGQAGVFDASVYMDNSFHDCFYDSCCKRTLSRESVGYVHKGFVTSSGYGDGGYDCLIYKKDGKAVAIEVIFIPKEGDDE